MPAHLPFIDSGAQASLYQLGEAIRGKRRALRISATTAAAAAGMSRVTWHRIEKGAASVTIGAYLNAMTALGLELQASDPSAPIAPARDPAPERLLPVRIRLSQYPQLRQLAWQVQGIDELTPREALDIYERNQRHMDIAALEQRERDLLNALHEVLSEERHHV